MYTLSYEDVISRENILSLWKANAVLLMVMFFVTIASPYLKSSVLEYPGVVADPWDGATMPIAFVPNWLDATYTNKKIRYENIPLSDFVKVPAYDPQVLLNDDVSDKIARLTRSTYITPYMGSYRMNFTEYDGSHLAVDIRSPLGTPVLSIGNGVVVKVKDTETADGKYVIIRHDNVTYQGVKDTFYSAYLHLESISAVEGTKIKKGEVLGKVGMTGITTTPHLHLQIDRGSAPFHAYWPYSFADTKAAGLDFFEAINVGFGKENAMKYTVHPTEFITALASLGSEKEIESIAIVEVPKQTVSSQTFIPAVVVETKKVEVAAPAPLPPLNSAPELPLETKSSQTSTVLSSVTTTSVAPEISTLVPVIRPNIPNGQHFSDVKKTSAYFQATAYLKNSNIVNGYNDGSFKPTKTLTRKEAVLILARAFSIEPTPSSFLLQYSDVKEGDTIIPYLWAFQDRGILSRSELKFRGDDTISKSEMITMILRASGQLFQNNDTTTLLKAFKDRTGYNKALFRTSAPISRGEMATMIYLFKTKS